MSKTACFVYDYIQIESNLYFRCQLNDYIATVPPSCLVICNHTHEFRATQDVPVTHLNDVFSLNPHTTFPLMQWLATNILSGLKYHSKCDQFKASLYWASKMLIAQKSKMLDALSKRLETILNIKAKPSEPGARLWTDGARGWEKNWNNQKDKSNKLFVQLFSKIEAKHLVFSRQCKTWELWKSQSQKTISTHYDTFNVIMQRLSTLIMFRENARYLLCDNSIELPRIGGVFSFDCDFTSANCWKFIYHKDCR